MARASLTFRSINRLPARTASTLTRAAADGAGAGAATLERITHPEPAEVENAKIKVERAVFGWGLINPMLALPQLHNIFIYKHAGGLSAVTIAAALLMSMLWMTHGLLGRQTALWVTSAIWVVLNSASLAGVLMLAD